MPFSGLFRLIAILPFSFLAVFFQTTYVAPSFPGGAKALNKYFIRYANYPSEELALEVNGECVATIYINKLGKVKFVNVTGAHRNFNQEAKRVLTVMPDWNPAKRGGIAIDTFITRKLLFSFHKPRVHEDSTVTELVVYYAPMVDTSEKNFYLKLAQKDIERIKRAPVWEQAVQALRDSQYVEAVHLFNKVQKMGEHGRDLYFNKGIAYFQLQEMDSACACWQTSARLGDKEALRIYQQKCR